MPDYPVRYNAYQSQDLKNAVHGYEIACVRMSTTGSGPTLLYKLYFYVRNIGWILFGSDPEQSNITNAIQNLLTAMVSTEQNKNLVFPFTT